MSFRAEEGLPLVSTNYMRLIIESYLARAQELYPVTIVSIVVMSNHMHLLLVVQDPANVPRFIGYFKRETAYAINKLIGRFKHTVWCDRYDSPIILDSSKTIERLIYSYTNPQAARLENTIEAYPNLTTWKELISGQPTSRYIPIFPRHVIPTLESDIDYSDELDERICNSILEEQCGTAELRIEPFAWFNCFPDTKAIQVESAIEEIVKAVKRKESTLVRDNGIVVIGAIALREQNIRKSFKPKKRGRKMLCLASNVDRRIDYLNWVFDLAKEAREKTKRWILENSPLILPPGFFSPGGKLSANICPFVLQT